MIKKENEAVVNRFLLSTLYFILGLCGIFALYKMSSSARFVMNYKIILYVLIVLFVVATGISIFKKSKYYGVICGCIILCLVVISVYFPIMAKMYDFLTANNLSFLFNSYASYGICAVIMFLFYIYEIVYYALNVKK